MTYSSVVNCVNNLTFLFFWLKLFRKEFNNITASDGGRLRVFRQKILRRLAQYCLLLYTKLFATSGRTGKQKIISFILADI